MAISADDVKTLRDRTNAPMMECKAALNEAGGDMDKAIDILRKKIKGADRQVRRPRNRRGARRRLTSIPPPRSAPSSNCAARPPRSPRATASSASPTNLAKQVALKNPASVEDLLAQAVDRRCEADGAGSHRRRVRPDPREHEAAPLHARRRPRRAITSITTARVGVLLQVEGEKADPQLLRDICMHIAAINPVAGDQGRRAAATMLAKETGDRPRANDGRSEE